MFVLPPPHVPPILSSARHHRHHLPSSSPPPPPNPPFHLRFHTSHRQNTHYLTTLGISSSSSKLPQTLSVVEHLKSKGFSDSHFPRLSFLCPHIFSSSSAAEVISALDLVFAFLAGDLSASPEQSCGLIIRCPEILAANVEFRLRPTLLFLRDLGLDNLNSPTTLNAHLLNTPIEKLVSKIRFLRSLGFSHEESARVCARLPALFGYSVENNLRPKVDYLVNEMGRSVEEVKEFPQYFAFSLEKRIVPRHLHLKARNARIPLKRMLLWGDERFYAKWK